MVHQTGNKSTSRPLTSRDNKFVRQAAFIVGCLTLEDIIPLDLRNSYSTENFHTAVYIVAKALETLEKDGAWIENADLDVME